MLRSRDSTKEKQMSSIVVTKVKVYPSFFERIQILFGARIHVEVETVVEVAGKPVSLSRAHVEPLIKREEHRGFSMVADTLRPDTITQEE